MKTMFDILVIIIFAMFFSYDQVVFAKTKVTIYPNKIVAKRGKVSKDQPLSVLSVKDQQKEDDDWNSYIDFNPKSKGVRSIIWFPVNSKFNKSETVISFKINFKGWDKKNQHWKFHIFNYKKRKWVYIGDNEKVKDWIWTLLEFKVPGNITSYVKNNLIKLRYMTKSSKENSHLDYISANLSTETLSPPPTTEPPTEPPKDRIWGVTIDGINQLSKIVSSLNKLSQKPTTRIVFDEFVPASEYVTAVKEIKKVSYIMGEILDSFYVKQYSVLAYKKRVIEYLDAFEDEVDLWEISNETNGEWLGRTSDVVAKMVGAYDQVKARKKQTVLTLYYNENCWEKAENEMFRWAEKNIPDRMKQGLDYVLISYYEDDCNNLRPNWQNVFDKLSKEFPNSKIGFSEVGTKYKARKKEYIERYYNMRINTPNYIGGYFWWYYRQDMVDQSKPYWKYLNNVISKF